MNLYHYHPETGEFIRESEARPDPGEAALGREAWLVPRYSTLSPPPDTGEGLAAVWTEESWSVVEDYRCREVYDKASGRPQLIKALGPLPPDTTTAPPAPFQVWNEESGSWVRDPNLEWASIRAERDRRIGEVEWRVNRHLAELRRGLTPTEPIEPLDEYIQALRELPQSCGDPENVIWPDKPVEAGS